MIAWSKRPRASGIVNMSAIDADPAETPKTVTREASPPKALIFSRTQRRAAS